MLLRSRITSILYQTETESFFSSAVSLWTWRTGAAGTTYASLASQSMLRGDVQAFLKETLPTLTGISFDPLLEFQRVHRLGPKRAVDSRCLHSIIACLLCHIQAQQLIFAACSQGPFRADGYEIHITADFSQETNERRKAFLSLCSRLRQLEVKYGLFEPARMWITKNGQCQDFYNSEDLRLYLDDLTPKSKATTPQTLPADVPQNSPDAMLLPTSSDTRSLGGTGIPQRGRDQSKYLRLHDNRDKVLLAVTHLTQQTDRDKSHSTLKPSSASA
ncbi:hypothetical protein NDU88_007236 [Pleurodeles waltl]|uniref:Uncharacterized protein n=1 Tax=Pleurodeles waltl TaxID=8319 RepID=A0AAV7SRR1_PLEWA|nr:hypothetical protein NDU88_007236 [Pleurodeles waltl]